MIRQAMFSDLAEIETTYKEHFDYEKEHGAFTVFQEGVYPTRKDAESALKNDALYIYEEDGVVLGSIIVDGQQPDEYKRVDWPSKATDEKVKVIHLLMVRHSAGKKGVGSALVSHAIEMVRQCSSIAVRLDTGRQNIPAVSLYQKLGFQLAGTATMKVGGAISHNGHLFFEKKI